MNTYQETLGYDQINYEQDIYYINSIKAIKKKITHVHNFV